MSFKQISELIRLESPDIVFEEVQIILNLIVPGFNTDTVANALRMTVDLFEGRYPGYRACNTEYHDLRHTTDTFLAMARMFHGAHLEGKTFTERHINLGLIAALLHDSGYIQPEHDLQGTGAKYTASHIQRSMDFFEQSGSEFGLTETEVNEGRFIILCTDLAADISTLAFADAEMELIGKILATADLLAQMADRTYLEKLLFLYYEFKEAKLENYESELDLLRKTVGFYDIISQRFKRVLTETDRFMLLHFASRWDIHVDLYHEAIENQKEYLKQILAIPDSDARDHLKRDRIVERVRRKYGRFG